MPIRVLASEVASQIAAGEVIERPASVVKELLENALDAGASEVAVEIRGGGSRLIRVIDNGAGIPPGEVELAFQRHATSKIASAEDLSHITTLGFRGEALPSIAAVAKVTLLTRPADEELGLSMLVQGGRVVKKERRGSPVGTIVTVENLFYNTPARRKFLKAEATEAGHSSDLVTRYAMAYPAVRFTLLNEGRTAFRSPGSGSLYEVLVAAYGLELAKQLLEIREQGEGEVRISGYMGGPSTHRSNARGITLLVNGRWVRDPLLSHALREAYHTLLPSGRYPLAVLRIDLPPEEVDVNVHPAKAEVRFRSSGLIFEAIQRAARRTLSESAPIPVLTRPAVPSTGPRIGRWIPAAPRPEPGAAPRPQRELPAEAIAAEPAGEVGPKVPPLRVLGQLGLTYVIAEGPDGMYLIDQHAAHERVLYERLLGERAVRGINSQSLLEPIPIELTPAQATTLEENPQALAAWGFDLEPFGGRQYLLRSMPAILGRVDPARALREILDDAAREGPGVAGSGWEARFVIGLACHSAVRAGEALSESEMRELIRQLESTRSPRTCAHGRPTMIHLSQEQLEREFGRR